MTHRIRSSAAWVAFVLVALLILLAPVAPVQAASTAPSELGSLTTNPVNPLQCYLDGVGYPLGTRLAAGPEFYRKCEMVLKTNSPAPPRYVAAWKIYPK